MHMSLLDWAIIAGLFIGLFSISLVARKYTNSVATFLGAGRCAGRYLLSISEGMAALDAVSIISQMQLVFIVGFAAGWWNTLMYPVMVMISIYGWIIYRFRQTKALTMAQFFEMRYSRNFRIFAGLLAYIAGIINYGIFPAIGANFFIAYCGLPPMCGPISTFAVIMLIILGVSLFFAWSGGQVSLLIIDFLQGMFCNLVLVAILILILIKFNMRTVFESLLNAPAGKSMVNPFDIQGNEGFTLWFFIIMFFVRVYSTKAWQSQSGFNCSALNAHEAKMAGVLGMFKYMGFWVSLLVIPLVAYAIMNNPLYADKAGQAQNLLAQIPNAETRSQMSVPVVMTTFVPAGLLGAFAAAMFAAAISTHSSQLHSWGSILVQDVIMPLRKKPLATEMHLKLLKISIMMVAVFGFFFSLWFKQSQHIQLFLMLTGAIYLSGAGSVIIGGLYWKRGTTTAAWSSMIVGMIASILFLSLDQIWTTKFGKKFPIDFKWSTVISVSCSIGAYIITSLINNKIFDMDRMLHRDENKTTAAKQSFLRKLMPITPEFTLFDKIIYGYAIFKSLIFSVIAITATVVGVTIGLGSKSWLRVHVVLLWYTIALSFIIVIWLTIGGFIDLGKLFKRLKNYHANESDDGRVEKNAPKDDKNAK